jgi:2-iminobutanoate/2-iminopropanoate deaminase
MADAVRFGNLLFCSGRAPVDPATLALVGEEIEEQARVVLRDVGQALEAAGTGWERVLRVQCFLAEPGDFPAWNRIWLETIPAPRPARTTVVSGFVVPGMRIEIEVTAAVGNVEA